MDDFNSILGTFYLNVRFQWTTLGSDNAALIICDIHLEKIPALHTGQIRANIDLKSTVIVGVRVQKVIVRKEGRIKTTHTDCRLL